MTMISGFLGCGKTTLLRYLLENQANMKFGVIVNDVATINVDAKLIRNDRNRGRDQQLNSTADLTDTIELANGCACEGRYCRSVSSRLQFSEVLHQWLDASVHRWAEHVLSAIGAARFHWQPYRQSRIQQQPRTWYGETIV